MAVRLNHTIVAAHDRDASARFLTEILGLSAPVRMGPFAIVQLGDTSLDFMESGGEIVSQHYAFLVTELEFDEIFGRIRARGLDYWADPSRRQRGQIQ
jgi:catechol 2,3-dioxygenase-like lactoylglutathione lyase family enzyme